MKRLILARSRGFTVMETSVAITVAGFIFAMLGSLIFVCSRSAMNMHDQVMSQTNASTAAERVTMLLRNAVGYRLVSPDTSGSGVTRVYAEFPASATSTTTHTVCLRRNANGTKDICYYTEKVTSWDSQKNPTVSTAPALTFRVADFKISFQNSYRLILTHSFVYKGFALIFHNPGLPQHGDFITEAIAKNHYMAEKVDNYADTESTNSVASY